MNEIVAMTDGFRSLIERAALDSNFDAAKMSLVLDRQEAWEKRQQLVIYNQAFARVQAEIEPAIKRGKNPTYNSTYATLFDLWEAAKPVLGMHGFSIRFGTAPNPRDGWQTVTLTLSHDCGYYEVHPLSGPHDVSSRAKTGIQTVGSTTTYLRRYLLKMVLNLIEKDDPDLVDDDGESARHVKLESERVASFARRLEAEWTESFGRQYRSDIDVAKQSLSTSAELGREAFRTQWRGTRKQIGDYLNACEPELIEAWQDKARAADERKNPGPPDHQSGQQQSAGSDQFPEGAY